MSPSYPTFSSLPPLPSSPPPPPLNLTPATSNGTHSQPGSRSGSRPPTPLHARSATGSTSTNGSNGGTAYTPSLPNHYNANPNYPLQPSASAQTIVPSPPRSEPQSVGEGSSFGGGGTDDHSDGEADAEDQEDLDLVPNLGDSGKFLDGSGPYRFPKHRLKGAWEDTTKTPLVIVACGSFSPPTYLHLRMFEMAKDQIVEEGAYEILGGYYSPVSDHYKKSGLAPAVHRVKMCELAVESTSTWLMVDPWEAGQGSYQRTAVVLQHFEEELNGAGGGVRGKDGQVRKIKIMLLAGGDLIESFGEPGIWAEPDLHVILGNFGCLIVERSGSDVWAFLLSHDILYHHRKNIIVVKQLIYNDISSTKVRLFVRRGMSIKYLLPNSVIHYIMEQQLYQSITAPTSVPLEITPSPTIAPPPSPTPPLPPPADVDAKKFFVAGQGSGPPNGRS
ncbi:hypothetical protein BDY24DRAFT_374163 [Mrakia frigida]|uniref:nicotinamide/nicotinic acid mononucleotide adenylyltransferase n=1 Tax=Mrakia frigida TaxID=29902 RepID=UPI003FCBF90E